VPGTVTIEARHLAAGFGLARAAFGLGYVVAPRWGARGWVGEEEARRSGDGRATTPWLAAHAVADLADTAGSMTATGIPERGRRLGVAVAGASAAASAALAVACARSPTRVRA
jgi:hypothetical protein